MNCKHCGHPIHQPWSLNPRYFPPPADRSWVHLDYVATDHNAEPAEMPAADKEG